jgi:hypothetical protein
MAHNRFRIGATLLAILPGCTLSLKGSFFMHADDLRDTSINAEQAKDLHLPQRPFVIAFKEEQLDQFIESNLDDKATFLLGLIQQEYPDAVLAERLGTDSKREYADVYKLQIGERSLVMKFLHFENGLSEFGAIPAILNDQRTLKAGLPSVAPYAGVITDVLDRPICVIAEYVDGDPLYSWLQANPEKFREMKDQLTDLLVQWEGKGFHLVDENPANFHITDIGVPVLIDPAAIAKHEQFVHGVGGHTLGLIGDGGVHEELDMLGFFEMFEDDHSSIDPYQDEDREDLAAISAQEPFTIEELVELLLEGCSP